MLSMEYAKFRATWFQGGNVFGFYSGDTRPQFRPRHRILRPTFFVLFFSPSWRMARRYLDYANISFENQSSAVDVVADWDAASATKQTTKATSLLLLVHCKGSRRTLSAVQNNFIRISYYINEIPKLKAQYPFYKLSLVGPVMPTAVGETCFFWFVG